jgi:hypothetical protein
MIPKLKRGKYSNTQSDAQLDLRKPVPLPVDLSTVSSHERDVARYRAEDARTGAQTDEDAPTIVRKKRGLRHVRTGR